MEKGDCARLAVGRLPPLLLVSCNVRCSLGAGHVDEPTALNFQLCACILSSFYQRLIELGPLICAELQVPLAIKRRPQELLVAQARERREVQQKQMLERHIARFTAVGSRFGQPRNAASVHRLREPAPRGARARRRHLG